MDKVSARPGRRSKIAAAPLLPEEDVQRLARFRRAVRRGLAASEQACVEAGLTTQRFQALLAIRASAARRMSIGELAAELYLRHHSAVELTDRLEKAGLVVRAADENDGRRVLLALSDLGEDRLAALVKSHIDEMEADREAFLDLFGAAKPAEA